MCAGRVDGEVVGTLRLAHSVVDVISKCTWRFARSCGVDESRTSAGTGVSGRVEGVSIRAGALTVAVDVRVGRRDTLTRVGRCVQRGSAQSVRWARCVNHQQPYSDF